MVITKHISLLLFYLLNACLRCAATPTRFDANLTIKLLSFRGMNCIFISKRISHVLQLAANTMLALNGLFACAKNLQCCKREAK